MNLLAYPTDRVPDMTTRGALERYGRLRNVGFNVPQATHLADAGYDVIIFAPVYEVLA